MNMNMWKIQAVADELAQETSFFAYKEVGRGGGGGGYLEWRLGPCTKGRNLSYSLA